MYLYQATLPPLTNRESWTQIIALTDADTGDPVDLTGATIQFEVRPARHHHNTSGYGGFYGGDGVGDGPILSATTANGAITVLDTGVFQAYFSETQMRGLRPGTYDVGCTISRDVDTRQVLVGHLPILNGVVTQ